MHQNMLSAIQDYSKVSRWINKIYVMIPSDDGKFNFPTDNFEILINITDVKVTSRVELKYYK